MASSRGAANAALYRAQTLLAAWERLLVESPEAEEHLRATFLPGVREHLLHAYGWFLLAVAGVEDTGSRTPPRSTAEVPDVEPGKALPPELREFRILEEEGWVGDLITAEPLAAPANVVRSSSADLLGSSRTAPGLAVAGTWAQRLETTMQRMDDLLAEC
jgi:hypothetical protein